MTWIQAAILGLVQGITEFLPISSSGHLAIVRQLLGLSDAAGNDLLFDVLLHFATLFAVFVVYRRDIVGIIHEIPEMLHPRNTRRGKRPDQLRRRLLLLLMIATLPLAFVILVKGQLEALDGNLLAISGALLLTGVLLFFADRVAQGKKDERVMTPVDAFLIGLAQALAVIPGLSRSGATISAGLLRGMERSFSVKFSFLLSVPAILGATLLELAEAIQAVASGDAALNAVLLAKYLFGMLIAGAAGYFSMRFLKFVARRNAFGGFAYYCWGAGLFTFALSLAS